MGGPGAGGVRSCCGRWRGLWARCLLLLVFWWRSVPAVSLCRCRAGCWCRGCGWWWRRRCVLAVRWRCRLGAAVRWRLLVLVRLWRLAGALVVPLVLPVCWPGGGCGLAAAVLPGQAAAAAAAAAATTTATPAGPAALAVC